MSQNIVVVDTVIKGYNHVTINKGLLEILCHAGNRLTLVSDEIHGQVICENLPCTVQKRPIKIIGPRGGIINKANDWYLKLKEEFHFFQSLPYQQAIQDADLVIFTTITPVNLFLHAGILNSLANSKKVVVGLHGEIEVLFKSRPTFREKLFRYFYKSALKKTPQVKFLLWSPFIEQNMLNAGYLKREQAFSAFHPLSEVRNEEVGLELPSHGKTFVFSHLGVASYRKNADKLFELSTIIDLKKSPDHHISIRNIGKVEAKMQSKVNPLVNILSMNNEVLTQKRYAHEIGQTHYVLSFISGEEYVNRISGSILDAVQYYRPIIALRHSFIEDIFDKAGDIGFLCDSLESMSELILRIVNYDEQLISRYTSQVKNLKAYAAEHYYPNNSIKFIEGLKKAYNK